LDWQQVDRRHVLYFFWSIFSYLSCDIACEDSEAKFPSSDTKSRQPRMRVLLSPSRLRAIPENLLQSLVDSHASGLSHPHQMTWVSTAIVRITGNSEKILMRSR
jgi:hypothetical protein